MRISDWSSDVCSSDLQGQRTGHRLPQRRWPHLPERRSLERRVDRLSGSGPRSPAAGQRHGHPALRRRGRRAAAQERSEEHTSELQSLMRNSYAVFCLKKKNKHQKNVTKKIRDKSTNI